MLMKITIKRVSAKKSYTIKELCRVLAVSRRTVDQWINDENLAVHGNRPVLIFGKEFIAFAKSRNNKAKMQKSCFDNHRGIISRLFA